MKRPEILSPAGSPEALRAAVNAGADAVYLAGEAFGARAYAKNFTREELCDGTKYAHERGVKLYVTVNTLVVDREMEELREYIAFLCGLPVDGLIVQDLGVAKLIRSWAPELPLHASTQCACHSLDGVRELHALGFSRVVLARELSLANIAKIARESPCELEVFVHGALCFSHSGQCLMSAVIGRRSANRGRCAGPCRLPYAVEGGRMRHQLSLKDLCAAEKLPELTRLGVASFKIEGRMKRPEYVSSVTRTYATAVRYGVKPGKREIDSLGEIFSRSGFTSEYLDGSSSRDMFGMRGEEPSGKYEAALRRERELAAEVPVERTLGAVDFALVVRADEHIALTARSGGAEVTVAGELPERARTRPLTEELCERQLRKTGGTGFEAGKITCTLGKGLTVPASALNALRRQALAELEAKLSGERAIPFCAETKPVRGRPPEELGLVASFRYLKQLPEEVGALRTAFFPLEAYDGKLPELPEIMKRVTPGVLLPRVVTDAERGAVRQELERLRSHGVREALCGNIGLLPLLRELGFEITADISMNAMNSWSLEALQELGVARALCSAELSTAQIRDLTKPLPCGVFAYGRLPLMVSENCLRRNELGCTGRCKLPTTLTDRTGETFLILPERGCRNLIVNGKPLYFADRREELVRAGASFLYLYFTDEERDVCARVLRDYTCGGGEKPEQFTRGLLTRGVL